MVPHRALQESERFLFMDAAEDPAMSSSIIMEAAPSQAASRLDVSSAPASTTAGSHNHLILTSLCAAFSSWSLLYLPPALSRHANRWRLGLCAFVVVLALSASFAHLRSIWMQSPMDRRTQESSRLYVHTRSYRALRLRPEKVGTQVNGELAIPSSLASITEPP